MCILAIDTAANFCAACLYDPVSGQVLATQSDDIGRGHAEHLLGMIDALMISANRTYDDITKIATSIGPGSFTGIRVGVAAARGFGLALDKPVVGVSTLQAIAADYSAKTSFAVAIKGGRGQAFVQCFDKDGLAQNIPHIVKLDDDPGSQIAPEYKALIGNAAELIDEARAADLKESATGSIERFAMLVEKSDMVPSPLYIRSADAKIAEGFALPRQVEKNQ